MSGLSIRTKFAYGIGQVGEQIKITGFDLFVFFYFQQVVGLSGTLCGAAVAIALVFDGISDPVAGAISDGWRSPRGRRHPFMYAAALPLAVFWFLLFFPPAGLGQLGLFVWLTTFAILVRASMTLYHVPHIAMGAELSDDYVERTSIVAWRVTSGVLGGVMTSAVALALFFPETAEFENGLLNPAGYPKVAIFGSVMMAITIWYSAWGTRDRIPFLPQAPANTARSSPAEILKSVWRGYQSAMSFVSFRAVFGGAACFTIAYGVTQTLQTHLYVFFWEFSSEQQALLRLLLLPGFFLGIMSTRWAHRRFDKKPVAVLGMAGLLFAYQTPVILRLFDVLPANGNLMLLPFIGLCMMLGSVAAGLAITTSSSMMADVTEHFEVETGRAQQGVLFSAIALAQKIGSAAGHVVAGIGLDLISFPTRSRDPENVDPIMIEHLGMLSLTAMLVSFAGIYAYTKYDLTKAHHDRSVEVLQARKAGGEGGTP
jgi:Na+/melibiose symporter-like transporter